MMSQIFMRINYNNIVKTLTSKQAYATNVNKITIFLISIDSVNYVFNLIIQTQIVFNAPLTLI